MAEIGEIEYAPDYKSKRVLRDSSGLPIDERGWPVVEVVFYDPVAAKAKRDERARLVAERHRLEQEIINAVKREDRNGMLTPSIRAAREALLEFETSLQKEGE